MNVLAMVFRGARGLAGALADNADDPKVEASARGAGVLIGLIERLTERKSIEEVQQDLAELIARETKPISLEELNAQRDKVLSEFGVG